MQPITLTREQIAEHTTRLLRIVDQLPFDQDVEAIWDATIHVDPVTGDAYLEALTLTIAPVHTAPQVLDEDPTAKDTL